MAKSRKSSRRWIHRYYRRVVLLLISISLSCCIFYIIAVNAQSVSRAPLHPEKQHNFTESRKKWIANDANVVKDMKFDSTEFPMVRHEAPIVPNVVHFIKFDSTNISFIEMVAILAAHINQKPEVIFIHCSLCSKNVTMSGHYWDILLTYDPPVNVLYFPEPKTIFNFKIASREHATDIARMLILMEHGGIYLDNDVYVVKPLGEFLHCEMSLGWDEENSMGTQVLVAHRSARFLRRWHDSYLNYDGQLQHYNARILPTRRILQPNPYLVNRVKDLFGVTEHSSELYRINDCSEWSNFFTVHLNTELSPMDFLDDETIMKCDRNFGLMVNLILHNVAKRF